MKLIPAMTPTEQPTMNAAAVAMASPRAPFTA
jgi:hypothetical protein